MEKRLSPDELAARLEEAKTRIEIGGIYRHYKGNDYKVLDIAILESTNETCIIYQALYDPRLTFVRPLESWVETVTINDIEHPRFAKK